MFFFLRLVASGSVVLLTILGLLGSYVLVYLGEPGPSSERKEIEVPPGATSGKIAGILEEAGVIRYPDLFSYSVRLGGVSKQFQAGEYALDPGISPAEIVHKMLAGDVIRRFFTLPEGKTSAQALTMMKENPLLAGASEIPPDGSLLPETYDYRKGETREALIARMRKAMDQALDEAWKARGPNLPVKDKREALILASVIEKETGKAEERPMVASVFVNRLRTGMRLQSDPTVIYAVTGGKEELNRPLSKKDLQINSPYNTYFADGLPPAPICNPGREAIQAALHPAVSGALYFVADGTGAHRFAATLEEHNANVQILRAWEAKKRAEQDAVNEAARNQAELMRKAAGAGASTEGSAPAVPAEGASTKGSAPAVPAEGASTEGSVPAVPAEGASTEGSAPAVPAEGASTEGSAPAVPAEGASMEGSAQAGAPVQNPPSVSGSGSESEGGR